jgi:hypothetical protein
MNGGLRGRSSRPIKVKNVLLHVVQAASGTLSFLSNGYRGFFPRGRSERSVNLTTHLQLVQRSRKHGDIHLLSPYVFMAESRTGTTLLLALLVQMRWQHQRKAANAPAFIPGPTRTSKVYKTQASTLRRNCTKEDLTDIN